MSNGSFLIFISGQIEWVDVLAAAGSTWHCKYEFVAGSDWKIIGGLEAGLSQTASIVRNGDRVVFNLPIEVIYKSTNPHGCMVNLLNDLTIFLMMYFFRATNSS